ncbi:Mss4-like protein [Panaeolus papilionaceus]|nr:Mss4-like protein [Panaeolus papilionaceus]
MASSSSSPPLTIRKGSCLCKTVKYEVTGEPITFRVCHCINCRKSSGSAFMSNLFFTSKQIKVLSGEEKLKVYTDRDTSSGNALNRHFCTECGSNVFLQPVNPQAIAGDIKLIAAGTLEDAFSTPVKTELFAAQKRHWVAGIHVQPKSSKL